MPGLDITVVQASGDETTIEGFDDEDKLITLMQRVEAELGIPCTQQKFLLDGAVLPRRDLDAPLHALGIPQKGAAQLTLVRSRVPTGAWSGSYDSRGYGYTCKFNCDQWEWQDAEMGQVEFEMEWHVEKHPDPKCIGKVGVEVYKGVYNSTTDAIEASGKRTYLKGGGYVGNIIGFTSHMEVKFEEDTATCLSQPDNTSMILQRQV